MLREDPYKLEAAKYRVREVVRNNLQDMDWSNNLFVGVAYFVFGEKDEGINCVEANVMFEFEREISGAVLAQIDELF